MTCKALKDLNLIELVEENELLAFLRKVKDTYD